MGTKQQ